MTSMTRKHFKAIAEAINASRLPAPECKEQADETARTVADNLRQFNPLFDRGKFLDACGVK